MLVSYPSNTQWLSSGQEIVGGARAACLLLAGLSQRDKGRKKRIRAQGSTYCLVATEKVNRMGGLGGARPTAISARR